MKKSFCVLIVAITCGVGSFAQASDYCAGTALEAGLGVAKAVDSSVSIENAETEIIEQGSVYKVTAGKQKYIVVVDAIYPDEGTCTVTSVTRVN